MEQRIKEHIEAHIRKEGWDVTDSMIEEVLTDQKHIYEEMIESHRWWDIYLYVVNIDGMLIGFEHARSTGDRCAWELGWEFDFDCVWEMQSVEKTITTYERKKQ